MSDVFVIPDLVRKPTKRVIIAGSRFYRGGIDGVARAIKESGFDVKCVISGAARGADKAGEEWAQSIGIPFELYPADWRTGKSAGVVRNAQMEKVADALIALMDMDAPTPGTSDMICRMKDKPTCIYWETAWSL